MGLQFVSVCLQKLFPLTRSNKQVAENQLLAPFVLNEVLDKKMDITAAVIIIVGALFTTIFGPQGGGEPCSVCIETGSLYGKPFEV